MNKYSGVLFLLMVAGISAAWGQTAPAPAQAPIVPTFQPVRMGFINLERALAEVQEGKKLFGELQVFIDKKNQELEAMRNEINKRQDQLKAQERTLSEETKVDLQKDLDERRTKLTRFQEDTSKEIERQQNVNIQKIGQKMQPLLQTYAKEKSLTAIVIWSPQLYAYVDDNVNVTDEIIKRYDAANPMPATPAPAKPKTPK